MARPHRRVNESLRQFLANDNRYSVGWEANNGQADPTGDAFSRYVVTNRPQAVSAGLRDYDAFPSRCGG